MAEKLQEPYERTSTPGPDSPYPWDDWLKPGTEWRLTKGEDFDCTTQSITDLARRHAAKQDRTVSVYQEEGGKVVLVNPPESEEGGA